MHPSVARAVKVVAQMSEIRCLRRGWAVFELPETGNLRAVGWDDDDLRDELLVQIPNRSQDAEASVYTALLRARDDGVRIFSSLIESGRGTPAGVEHFAAYIKMVERLLGPDRCPVAIEPRPWDAAA